MHCVFMFLFSVIPRKVTMHRAYDEKISQHGSAEGEFFSGGGGGGVIDGGVLYDDVSLLYHLESFGLLSVHHAVFGSEMLRDFFVQMQNIRAYFHMYNFYPTLPLRPNSA